MTQAKTVLLYTRPDCHLCELAEPMLEDSGVNWQAVDIETDLNLIRKYGSHIPVLYRADIDRELFWPFNEVAVDEFINHET